MRFAKRLVALAAAVTLAGAAPPDPLRVVAAANGHPAEHHLRGTSERTIEGRRVVETLDRFGTARLIRRCIADVCSGSWFDGTRYFTFGLNEVPLPENDALPARRTLAAIASLAFAEPSFRATGGSVTADGPSAWRVRVRDGATLIARLDPATHALRRVLDEKGDVIASYGRDVRVDGAVFALDVRGLDDVSLQTASAATEPLAAPSGAPVTFAGEGGTTLGDDAVPIVPCTLAGRQLRCLLDTGATPSAMVLTLAEDLGLEPRGELEISAFSRFVTGFVDAGPLTLGAAHFAQARFAVVPAVRAARFDVVVGADLLGRVRLVIDRAHRRAEIVAPRDAPPPAAVALRFRNGVPMLEASLDGHAESALFDSGDSSVVSLGYAEYRRGPQWPLVERVQAVGVAGASDAFVVAIPDVRIGNVALGTVRATVSRTQRTTHVGIGMWSRCLIELDEALEALGCALP